MEKLTVANTIYEQLGGRKFSLMTGAKNFIGSAKSLRMTLPRNKSGAKYLEIELRGNDTYTMRFSKMKGLNVLVLKEYEDVYSNQIVSVFEKVTEYYTQLR